jgi:hypothetical protein
VLKEMKLVMTAGAFLLAHPNHNLSFKMCTDAIAHYQMVKVSAIIIGPRSSIWNKKLFNDGKEPLAVAL